MVNDPAVHHLWYLSWGCLSSSTTCLKMELLSTSSLPPASNDSEVQSLYLTSIPHRAQHLLLTVTQCLLEDCCFEFAIRSLPDILKEHMWDCPEAVELNKWICVLLKYFSSLPQYTFNDGSGLPLKTVFLSVNKV